MTNGAHYRLKVWFRERGSLIGMALLLFWAAGVIWMIRMEATSTADTFEDEEGRPGSAEASTDLAGEFARSPARLMAPKAEFVPALEGGDVSWKISTPVAEAIKLVPLHDQHAVVVFREGVRYRRACEVLGLTGMIITSASYQGSYRIGVVGSGRALESLARFPEVFRLDAR